MSDPNYSPEWPDTLPFHRAPWRDSEPLVDDPSGSSTALGWLLIGVVILGAVFVLAALWERYGSRMGWLG